MGFGVSSKICKGSSEIQVGGRHKADDQVSAKAAFSAQLMYYFVV